MGYQRDLFDAMSARADGNQADEQAAIDRVTVRMMVQRSVCCKYTGAILDVSTAVVVEADGRPVWIAHGPEFLRLSESRGVKIAPMAGESRQRAMVRRAIETMEGTHGDTAFRGIVGSELFE
tara:strand:- start:894 stop:1259 length:366 start_codon:yes stop_codon:yes gene_type:complete